MNGILQSWTIPTHLVMGSLLGPMTLMRDLPLILTLMNLGITPKRAIQTLSILDDSSSTLTPCSTLMTNQHVFRTNQHDVSLETPDYEKFRPYFGWVNVDTVHKTMEQWSYMMSVWRPLTMKNSDLILVGSMWILFTKPWNSLPNGESPYPIHSL